MNNAPTSIAMVKGSPRNITPSTAEKQRTQGGKHGGTLRGQTPLGNRLKRKAEPRAYQDQRSEG